LDIGELPDGRTQPLDFGHVRHLHPRDLGRDQRVAIDIRLDGDLLCLRTRWRGDLRRLGPSGTHLRREQRCGSEGGRDDASSGYLDHVSSYRFSPRQKSTISEIPRAAAMSRLPRQPRASRLAFSRIGVLCDKSEGKRIESHGLTRANSSVVARGRPPRHRDFMKNAPIQRITCLGRSPRPSDHSFCATPFPRRPLVRPLR
jgi:hypothetical protein